MQQGQPQQQQTGPQVVQVDENDIFAKSRVFGMTKPELHSGKMVKIEVAISSNIQPGQPQEKLPGTIQFQFSSYYMKTIRCPSSYVEMDYQLGFNYSWSGVGAAPNNAAASHTNGCGRYLLFRGDIYFQPAIIQSEQTFNDDSGQNPPGLVLNPQNTGGYTYMGSYPILVGSFPICGAAVLQQSQIQWAGQTITQYDLEKVSGEKAKYETTDYIQGNSTFFYDVDKWIILDEFLPYTMTGRATSGTATSTSNVIKQYMTNCYHNTGAAATDCLNVISVMNMVENGKYDVPIPPAAAAADNLTCLSLNVVSKVKFPVFIPIRYISNIFSGEYFPLISPSQMVIQLQMFSAFRVADFYGNVSQTNQLIGQDASTTGVQNPFGLQQIPAYSPAAITAARLQNYNYGILCSSIRGQVETGFTGAWLWLSLEDDPALLATSFQTMGMMQQNYQYNEIVTQTLDQGGNQVNIQSRVVHPSVNKLSILPQVQDMGQPNSMALKQRYGFLNYYQYYNAIFPIAGMGIVAGALSLQQSQTGEPQAMNVYNSFTGVQLEAPQGLTRIYSTQLNTLPQCIHELQEQNDFTWTNKVSPRFATVRMQEFLAKYNSLCFNLQGYSTLQDIILDGVNTQNGVIIQVYAKVGTIDWTQAPDKANAGYVSGRQNILTALPNDATILNGSAGRGVQAVPINIHALIYSDRFITFDMQRQSITISDDVQME